jgi:hypothetical protein
MTQLLARRSIFSRAALLFCAPLALSGCSTIPVFGPEIGEPAKGLMRPAAEFPDPAPGTDARVALADAAAAHAANARKIRGLQKYVKTVRGQ